MDWIDYLQATTTGMLIFLGLLILVKVIHKLFFTTEIKRWKK